MEWSNLTEYLNLCCARGEVLNGGCKENMTFFDVPIEINNDNNESIVANLFDSFNFTFGKPCREMAVMLPDSYPDEKWTLFRNGTIILGEKLLNSSNYCLNPTLKVNSSELSVNLMTCFEELVTLKYTLLPIGMILSVPFLIATFLVYAILPELRNVHGKSLMCYLSGLTIGYSVLSFIQLNGSNYLEPMLCETLGLIIYGSFMSAFFWLSVISFDLWWNFRGMKGISKLAEQKKFLIYSIYAWGSSLLMISLCVFMDSSDFISSNYKPGLGNDSCFLKKHKLTEFLYFYLPIIIIICFNSTFFILTALKIRKVQMEMTKITAKEDSRRHQTHLDNEKAKFGLFLRLFIIMGITWCMEAISWAVDPTSQFFCLTDICNTVQGVMIFVLFVVKPKVKQLMIKRLREVKGKIRKSNTDTTGLGG